MKLIVLIGCSGSGKSTWAHSEWQKDKLNAIIVNRDKIRELLFGYTESTIKDYYSLEEIGKLEKQVTLYEDTLIYEALVLGRTVIVDATHLEKRYLSRFEMFNVYIEYKVFDLPLSELIDNDSSRVRRVGVDVIKRQYDKLKSLVIPSSFVPVRLPETKDKPYCFVFDIDGTLADKGDRSPYDWSRVGEDKPIKSIIRIFEELSYDAYLDDIRDYTFICSGRDASCIEESKEWIDSHVYGASKTVYLFRKEGDMRPDWKVKQEMALEICETHNILGWFDDRLQVTRHLRQLGIKVLNVEHNNF